MSLFETIIWVPLSLYTLAFVSQLLKNRHHEHTHGVSTGMIFARMGGEVAHLFYIYLLGLPLAYRVMVPVYSSCIWFLLGQELWYSRDTTYGMQVFFGLTSIIVAAMVGLSYAIMYPTWTGNISGWLYVGIFVFAQFPQAYKNYCRSSVHGFSFSYTILMASGSLIELVSAIALQLPVQTIIDLIRGLFFYALYWYQFVRYRKKSKEEIEFL